LSQLVEQVKKTKSSKSIKQTPQQVFERRWLEVDKALKSLEKARNEQQGVVDKFNADLLPLEQDICRQQYSFINTLLKFYGKKSLLEWQREDTFDWIDEIFNSLASSPFRPHLDIDALASDIHQSLIGRIAAGPQVLELLRNDIIESTGIDLNLTDEDLLAILANPDLLAKKLAQASIDGRGLDDPSPFDDGDDVEDIFEDMFSDYFDNFADDKFNDPAAHEKNELFLSKGVLNRCYKKLANRFHPDKVKPEDREESHHLMVELSKAKKANDAFSIFMLYQQYIADDDFVFSDNELTHINVLLSKKLQDIRCAKADLKFGDDMDTLICRKFKGRSKRATEQNFADHLDEMQQRLAIYNNYSQITSLKILKKFLAERRDMMNVISFW